MDQLIIELEGIGEGHGDKHGVFTLSIQDGNQSGDRHQGDCYDVHADAVPTKACHAGLVRQNVLVEQLKVLLNELLLLAEGVDGGYSGEALVDEVEQWRLRDGLHSVRFFVGCYGEFEQRDACYYDEGKEQGDLPVGPHHHDQGGEQLVEHHEDATDHVLHFPVKDLQVFGVPVQEGARRSHVEERVHWSSQHLRYHAVVHRPRGSDALPEDYGRSQRDEEASSEGK
mmetsp:Transcript_5860/g.9454  ORF Transcript_5860/g.9454 Transcript_5860/m.9454 type:complete len:227 (+) Transcript_5860:936-1616(+)